MADKMEALRRLAELHGVQTTYYTIEGQRRDAKPEVLLAILKALGAPIQRLEDAPDALHRLLDAAQHPPSAPSSSRGEGMVAAPFMGASSDAGMKPAPTPSPSKGEGEGGGGGETLQPLKAWSPGSGERRWGVFVPLYSLRSSRNWGVGDFTDIENLVDWVGGLGGGIVGTLPLLATFLDDPFAACPYTPVSRMFWNELFIDVEGIPELADTPEASSLASSADFRSEIREQREIQLVDYRGVMQLKRRVLERLADSISSRPGGRLDAFLAFRSEHPRLNDYARFRAVGERSQQPWRTWPEPARNGTLTPGDSDPRAEQYHAYVQWIAHEQLTSLARRARMKNVLLYLDFPLGVHPDGYDAWRFSEMFVEGVSVGAPPDPFFSKGQRWGFAPLHPQRLLDSGNRLWSDSIRHHMGCAGILRIDHVMGLHRQFWIPDGFEAMDGVYVRYPKSDLYDALCRESLAHETIVVGEDLGTVPEELRPALHERGILRLFILSFEQDLTGGRPLPTPPFDSVAGLNTHDIPPFAALWGDRPNRSEALRRCHDHLAGGPAFATLVNLEDLWFETEPQNRPGTTDEFPNWRRKARKTFEEFSSDGSIMLALKRVDRLRRGVPPES
ncbi:MAG: 4-alpha-glucanotransferase [Nitrospirae bacterium]|nr:4-alpha-glucanotransferase [Nitrospirota bacterium]